MILHRSRKSPKVAITSMRNRNHGITRPVITTLARHIDLPSLIVLIESGLSIHLGLSSNVTDDIFSSISCTFVCSRLNYATIREICKDRKSMMASRNIRLANPNNNFLNRYNIRKFSSYNSTNPKEIKVSLTEQCFNLDNLLSAWIQIKSNPSMMARGSTDVTLNNIKKEWFEKSHKALLNGSFKYPRRRRVYIPKPASVDTRPISINNPRVKMIERAILNVLEPIFEGTWNWIPILEEEYHILEKNPQESKGEIKQNKQGYFKKIWHHKPIFSNRSYGFRTNKSAHGALKEIKF